jgi:hypothetical protein
MGYKYRQGETPAHVDSSQSDPTNPHLGVFPDSSDVVAKKKADNYKALVDGGSISKKAWMDSGMSAASYNGKGGEFSDKEMSDYKAKVDDANKSEAINNANAAKRGMVKNILSKTKAQSDATSVKRK